MTHQSRLYAIVGFAILVGAILVHFASGRLDGATILLYTAGVGTVYVSLFE